MEQNLITLENGHANLIAEIYEMDLFFGLTVGDHGRDPA